MAAPEEQELSQAQTEKLLQFQVSQRYVLPSILTAELYIRVYMWS